MLHARKQQPLLQGIRMPLTGAIAGCTSGIAAWLLPLSHTDSAEIQKWLGEGVEPKAIKALQSAPVELEEGGQSVRIGLPCAAQLVYVTLRPSALPNMAETPAPASGMMVTGTMSGTFMSGKTIPNVPGLLHPRDPET